MPDPYEYWVFYKFIFYTIKICALCGKPQFIPLTHEIIIAFLKSWKSAMKGSNLTFHLPITE